MNDDEEVFAVTPAARQAGYLRVVLRSYDQSDSAVTWDSVDSAQSDGIENSLTGQGTSDHEMTREVSRDELVEQAERARLKRSGQV